MRNETQIFTGGFADPVLAAQAVFRALMDGMASPTTITSVIRETESPAPAPRALAAIALTLLDHDTSVFLAPSLAGSAFPQWLAFHTGAPVTEDRMVADFALHTLADGFPDLSGYALGSDTYPDRSTTLIVEVESLTGGDWLTARGPGIRDTASLSPRRLPDGFLADWSLNHGLYPRGLDLILVSGSDFLCLPRTTRLSKQEA